MKVLHIGKYFPPYAGGMETYLRDLMVAQQKQGLDPSALVHQSSLSLKSRDESYQQSHAELPVTRAAVWARLLFTPISPTFPWQLGKLIKANRPDILHLHMPNVSAFWALLLPSARRVPWVVHWHADVLASSHSLGLRLFYGLYRPFETAILRRAKAIIATSPPYLASSAPLQPFKDKCHVVPLGLDPQRLPPLKPSPPRNENAPLRVLAIGRLTYYKGFEYLIRAAAECEQVEVHLVGIGERETALKRLSHELGLASRVIFHGQLSDEQLAEQFAACECLCLPSIERTEAFGMVLLEAMHYGKTTLVSNVPGSGMGWVVKNGRTGLHTKPGDPVDLARQMALLQENSDKLGTFGENGRHRFGELFRIDKSAAGVASIYSEIEQLNSVNQ